MNTIMKIMSLKSKKSKIRVKIYNKFRKSNNTKFKSKNNKIKRKRMRNKNRRKLKNSKMILWKY